MTNRPTPARLARRRNWALPLARALGRPAAHEPRPLEETLPPLPLVRDEDFLRRLREAGL